MIRCFLLNASCWTILWIGTLVNCSFADYIYFDGPSSVSVNSPFAIDVYLVSSNSALADTNNGIISGSFGVEIVSGSSTLTQVVGNTAFDSYLGPTTFSPWNLSQNDLDPNDGTPIGSAFGTDFRFKLGRIEGLSATNAETSLFRVIDPDNMADDLMLGDGAVLDGSVFPTANFALDVTGSSEAVPEPSSLALVAIGATVAGYRYTRRRFRKEKAKANE